MGRALYKQSDALSAPETPPRFAAGLEAHPRAGAYPSIPENCKKRKFFYKIPINPAAPGHFWAKCAVLRVETAAPFVLQ